MLDRRPRAPLTALRVLLALALPAAADARQGAGGRPKPFVATPLRVALQKMPVAKGSALPGFGVTAALPAEAFRAKVGANVVRFFDLDADGKLAVGTDGMAIDDAPFVVPIVAELLLRDGQFQVAFDGTATVVLAPEDLGPVRDLVSEAAVLTEMRMRAGLKPFALDLKCSAACRSHCDYVVGNGLLEGTIGISIHDEDPARTGWTKEGAAAGTTSDLWPFATSLEEALLVFYATVWHAVPIFDPAVERVGVAIVPKKIAMLGFVGIAPGKIDFAHPVDGATGIPCEFNRNGEVPSPVPGRGNASGCGFPVLMRLSGKLGELESAQLLDPKGRAVGGTSSSPENPANREWPTNSKCAAFVPSMPLLAGTTYHAVFKFKGAAEPVRWSFTTRKAK